MNLTEWSKRDKDSAEHRNQVVRAVNDNLPVTGGLGINSTIGIGGKGTTVAVDVSPNGRIVPTIGRIVTAGGGGETNWSDYRYWVQLVSNQINLARHVETGELSLTTIPSTAANANMPVIVTAYNASEFVAGSHTLPEDSYVYLLPISIDEPVEDKVVPRPRWFILSGASSESVGNDEGQVHIMVANNVDGWDYPFAVSTS